MAENVDRPFWHFNIGHLLTLLGMAGTLIVMFSKFEARLSVIENDVGWIKQAISAKANL